MYLFRLDKAIGIEDARESQMRLSHDRINVKWVAVSKPQAIGMDVNTGGRLNIYVAATELIFRFAFPDALHPLLGAVIPPEPVFF